MDARHVGGTGSDVTGLPLAAQHLHRFLVARVGLDQQRAQTLPETVAPEAVRSGKRRRGSVKKVVHLLSEKPDIITY